MRLAPSTELPGDLEPAMRRGTRLVIAMVGYLVVEIVVLYLLMGGSQSAVALVVEDGLELVPPILFLASARIRQKRPSERYPYGFHRVVTLGFFGSALALLAFGFVIFGLAAQSLVQLEHPTIGPLQAFGQQVWRGWLVIGWLVLSVAVPVVLGRLLVDPARTVNNKILLASARMLAADWQSAVAAAVGLLGIAVGWWWADGAAAAVIALGIIADGVRNTKQAAAALIDRMPTRVGSEEIVRVVGEIERIVERCHWAGDAEVRLREHGQVYFGEVIVDVGDGPVDVTQLGDLHERIMRLD